MKTIIWKSEEYGSLEYCSVSQHSLIEVRSKIIGACGGQSFYVEYNVAATTGWSVQSFSVSYEINHVRKTVAGEKSDEAWTINGHAAPDFTGFRFIDISLTPLTNTLPIRNLNLPIGERQEIDVIYMDILEDQVRPARQCYKRLEERSYRFENVPNDFEADITVDASGFVERYPSLFEKIREYVTV